jgi:hypothetical protein
MSVTTELSSSQTTDLSGSYVDDAPTASLSSSSLEFSYIKDSNNLTYYALDFMNDEISYYPIIKSYTYDEKVSLFICVNGLVTVGAYYADNCVVSEFFRNNDTSEKEFTSLQEWYNDYYGEVAGIDKLLNNIFIGEDLVPLWKVLVDEKESEENVDEVHVDEPHVDEPHVEEDTDVNVYYSHGFVAYITMFLVFIPMFATIIITLFD